MPESQALDRIPFNRPFLAGRELEYVRDAIASGQISAGGRFTARCEALLEEALPARRALLTTSCTHALELAALLLGVAPGDEVIVPSFTFVSTANAFVSHGARPVFVDVRRDTLNLDERLVEARLGPRTKAIVPVHYAGVACELDALDALARRRGVPLVEDNAHGLFGRFRGRALGTFGAVATLSFHETKNFTCGEGGALLVNDPALVERAEVLRDKGTDRGRFFRGEVPRYTWVDHGSSWGLSELLAAYLLAQLERREQIWDLRRAAWARYDAALAGWAKGQGLATPTVPDGCEPAYHLYHLVMRTPAEREALIASLRARDILAIFHYQPLHLSKMGRRFGGREGDCPVAEALSERLVRLPLYNGITPDEQGRVIDAVRAFVDRGA